MSSQQGGSHTLVLYLPRDAARAKFVQAATVDEPQYLSEMDEALGTDKGEVWSEFSMFTSCRIEALLCTGQKTDGDKEPVRTRMQMATCTRVDPHSIPLHTCVPLLKHALVLSMFSEVNIFARKCETDYWCASTIVYTAII